MHSLSNLRPEDAGETVLAARSNAEVPAATRTTLSAIRFQQPFLLPGIDGQQPPGEYEIVSDEALIEGLSRLAYHRVATFIRLPAVGVRTTTVQLVPVDPEDIQFALQRDCGPIGTDGATID